ncbi:MAG: sigma-70 family polymerase sigma factor, partial [Caulobacteraceae bacterium]|nr:sigma-70 family polymerase sigma factor [Caulobacteraceae bacterium]
SPILLQTTIEPTPDDWSMARFSLLREHLEGLRGEDSKPLHVVTARDRDSPPGTSDAVLATIDESDFDELWLFAVDSGDGLNAEECAAIGRNANAVSASRLLREGGQETSIRPVTGDRRGRPSVSRGILPLSISCFQTWNVLAIERSNSRDKGGRMSNRAEPKIGKLEAETYVPSGDSRPSPSLVERLFREHNETLLRFLRARLRSDADAREAAQEAYVRLLQLDRSDQPSFLRAYLFRIASNVATDMLRRKNLQARFATGDEQAPSSAGAQEDALGARQQLQLVQSALNELPPRCRQAFLLRRQEDLATTQIGERLGVSDRMVRLYLARAIEHVQQALDREDRRV